MYAGYYEEVDKCPKCRGALEYPEIENCSCHINPPCAACTSNELTCTECGHEPNADKGDHTYISAGIPGVSIREYKPKPLDKSKIDYRIKMHSSCSQLVYGVYPEGTSRDEVRKVVTGPFGGRFQMFGGGKFRFVAYTD